MEDQKNEINKTVTEIYDKDGDGHESVTEYVEKKRIDSAAKKDIEEQQKQEKKEKGKEKLKKAINVAKSVGNTVAEVAKNPVPHVALLGAMGMTPAILAKIFTDGIKDKK